MEDHQNTYKTQPTNNKNHLLNSNMHTSLGYTVFQLKKIEEPLRSLWAGKDNSESQHFQYSGGHSTWEIPITEWQFSNYFSVQCEVHKSIYCTTS